MKSRLFHAIIICGAALGAPMIGCAPAGAPPETEMADDTDMDRDTDPLDRCLLPDGQCVEHCAPLAGGQCLDPCFVHTTECSPDCRQSDGSCGWPPTK